MNRFSVTYSNLIIISPALDCWYWLILFDIVYYVFGSFVRILVIVIKMSIIGFQIRNGNKMTRDLGIVAVYLAASLTESWSSNPVWACILNSVVEVWVEVKDMMIEGIWRVVSWCKILFPEKYEEVRRKRKKLGFLFLWVLRNGGWYLII